MLHCHRRGACRCPVGVRRALHGGVRRRQYARLRRLVEVRAERLAIPCLLGADRAPILSPSPWRVLLPRPCTPDSAQRRSAYIYPTASSSAAIPAPTVWRSTTSPQLQQTHKDGAGPAMALVVFISPVAQARCHETHICARACRPR